jgi:uncharacterized metal-binding protein
MSGQSVCSGGAKMVFACSGAADVGAVADRAARKLHKEGAGQMFCLAGIGGGVEPIMQKTRTATTILAIDGCPLNCVSECLKKGGFPSFKHYLVTDLGLEKGKTEINEANIEKVAAKGRELLG